MIHDETKAMAWFIEQHKDLVAGAERLLILNALPGPYLSHLTSPPIVCLQTFKPVSDTLQQAGYRVLTDTEGTFDLVLFFGTRHRDKNHYLFAHGRRRLREGGTLVCAMPNSLGASRYRKDLGALFGHVQSLSKFKCKVFWATQTPHADADLAERWMQQGTLQRIPGSDLYAYPGTFSSDKLDTGSLLLSRSLPIPLSGAGADVGAGYGYLSHALLQHAPNVQALHLYEADYLALEAAKHNLHSFAEHVDLTFHWHDVTTGLTHQSLDWIVMNPPFHSGRHATVDLGRAFIRASASALRTGGTLHLVANQHLPYEDTLRHHYRVIDLITRDRGFKVYRARR